MTVFRSLIMCLLLLPVVLCCGCGCGGVTPVQDPMHVLSEYDLAIRLEADKNTYSPDEPVQYWLSVQNNDTRAHELTLHPQDDQQGGVTYGSSVSSAGQSSGSLWFTTSTERVTKTVQPGQSVLLVEFVWDQKTNAGASVEPGQYYLRADATNIYLDGGQVSEAVHWTTLVPCQIQITE